ncbi:MAG: 50S ribosomal protein L29 [Patescibacteria group bacterium]|jgi:large subunit ribosomal protein L29
MKIAELRKLSIEKLNESLADLRNKNREFRFSIANNQLKNIRQIRTIKKDAAKVLTVLNEKRMVSEDKTKEEKK